MATSSPVFEEGPATSRGATRVVAVDLGASSGRVFLAEFGRNHFEFSSGPPVLERSHPGWRSYPLGCSRASIVAFSTASA